MNGPDFSELPDSAISQTRGASSAESLCWLEGALRATPGGGDGANDTSNEELLKNLLDIRKVHAGEEFELLSAGQKMVEAALSARYGARMFESMSAAIIESLGNDPVCRQRLESLWDRLGKTVGSGK